MTFEEWRKKMSDSEEFFEYKLFDNANEYTIQILKKAFEDGFQEGFDAGRDEGFQEGYYEGHSDGYDEGQYEESD